MTSPPGGKGQWEVPDSSGLDCVALALMTKPTLPGSANEWRLVALAAPEVAV